jgi:hypothetical protein
MIVERLPEGFRGAETARDESAEAMRDLIETVKVFRDPSRIGGVEVEIAGRLTALLGEGAFPHGVKGVGGMMVAGEGSKRHGPFWRYEAKSASSQFRPNAKSRSLPSAVTSPVPISLSPLQNVSGKAAVKKHGVGQ